MLKKKSIYRRPFVILASVVVLILFNIAVVNNPMFATRIGDLTEQTEAVSEMSVEESNAQLAEMADSMVAETDGTITAINCRQGDNVLQGDVLIVIG